MKPILAILISVFVIACTPNIKRDTWIAPAGKTQADIENDTKTCDKTGDYWRSSDPYYLYYGKERRFTEPRKCMEKKGYKLEVTD